MFNFSERQLRQLKNDYRFAFGSEEGRRVLDHILETSCAMESSYDTNGRVENTFFNEGRRAVALMILDMLGRRIVYPLTIDTGEKQ